MNDHDDNLQEFFDAMRQADEQLEVPSFDEIRSKKTPTRRHYLFPMGIAASLLLLFSIYMGIEDSAKEMQANSDQETPLLVAEPVEMTTRSLLEDDASIYAWEAPTSTLIDDFK